MHVSSFLLTWILTISCVRGYYVSATSSRGKRSSDVKEFFDQMEKVMDRIMVESKTEKAVDAGLRQMRYLIPESVVNQEKAVESVYTHDHKMVKTDNSYPSASNNPFYNADAMDSRNSVLDFEGYQDFIFRPLYPCDVYDSSERHCVFRRQLGTTITLGVEVGDSKTAGIRIYWFRCLRKKYFDHVIKEPLNKGFLPWNLNLGGSGNELRISPISEMDMSYNYFVAELVTPQAYKGKYGRKSVIRFDIKSIEIDMGLLYHGEEIVIYARSFMELPQTSVNFLWSLQERDNFDDRGLPSNMQLNADKSSVIIKELKTYQDQYLTCRAYSNKDFFLAKRSFLFRGFGNNKTNITSNRPRQKRDTEDMEQAYDESNRMQYEDSQNPPNTAQRLDAERMSGIASESENLFHQVPGIAENLFYDSGRNGISNVPLSSEDLPPFSLPENPIAKMMRRFIQHEEPDANKQSKREFPERPRFEDIESQTIATCREHSDCNVRATCTRSALSGQNFCRCLHGFNGNGMFCFIS